MKKIYRIQKHYSYKLYKEEYDERYDRMQLNINSIIEIIDYFEKVSCY